MFRTNDFVTNFLVTKDSTPVFDLVLQGSAFNLFLKKDKYLFYVTIFKG